MSKHTHSVKLEELGSRADEIAAEMRAGHRLELTENGRRIAEILPCPEVTPEQRDAARKHLLELMDSGLDWGGVPFTYEERHER